MSGPIDFVVVVGAVRLAAMAASRLAEEAERMARTQARLAEKRIAAAKRTARLARETKRAEKEFRQARAQAAETQRRQNLADLAERSAQTDAHLAKLRSDAATVVRRGTSESDEGVLQPPKTPAQVTHPARQDAELSKEDNDRVGSAQIEPTSVPNRDDRDNKNVAASDKGSTGALDASVCHESFNVLAEQLIAWQDVLADEEAVKHFRKQAASEWSEKVTTVIADYEQGKPVEGLLHEAQSLLAMAQQIHDEAGQDQAKFANRNELLLDIMSSLQENGYFVKDPVLSNPADPAGPVLVTAIRGDEEMQATVDFSDTIHSVWNGSEVDHCKYAFFDYVDSMKARGIDVSTTRDDLQERPKLKQKGAKELPRKDAEDR